MTAGESRGLISLFVGHPVAGNLLMLLMLMFGVYGMTQLSRQLLPDFDLHILSVTVQWPGASPEDVEANVIEAIEAEVRFLEDVDKVESTAFAGRADVKIRFTDRANMAKSLTDSQASVARITTFPADIERPVITQLKETDEVCKIEINGPFSEHALKVIAKQVRDDLLDLGMSDVLLAGVRDSEIWVEVSGDVLRRLDLTVDDIARRIEQSSLDLPSGSIESGGVSRQIRSEELARTAPDVGEIEVLSRASGEKLRIKDIARIVETFEESAVSHKRLGESSAGLVVKRARGIDSIESQRIVSEYVAALRAELPPTLSVDMFDVFADQVTQRVRMLVVNGLSGLALVLIVLFVFLDGRVAFWVAMGIPVAVFGTLGVMALSGMTLNMISMFAIIMGLGIIVDDAIVVGEHTEMLHRHGLSPEQATSKAAHLMFPPVLAASLTTIAAFFPILTVGQEIGRIMREVPLTVMTIIVASLVECFLILPMHLRNALKRMDQKHTPKEPRGFRLAFINFRDNQFQRAVRFCFAHGYSTVLAAICAFAIALTLLTTGRIGFEFFPSPEVDIVYGNFYMSPGTPRARTEAMIDEMARSLRAVEDRLTGGKGGLVSYELGTIGTTEGRQGGAVQTGDHTGAYTVELIPGDDREVRNDEFMLAWENEIRPIAGVESWVVFERSAGGPPGRDLDIRVHGASLDVLKAAALELRVGLRKIPGISALEDNLPHGKEEILLHVTPAGRAMGFTAQSVARQVRDAYEGTIAKRFSQDQEERIVRVKLRESADSAVTSIRELYLRAEDGTEVPLTEVVDLDSEIGYAMIRRENGLRQVSITADVDSKVTTSNEVLALVARDIEPDIEQAYGVQIEFKGKAEEQAEALGDTVIALFLALLTMYVILAWVFSSYTTPLVVMSIIPFGLVGALVGHYVLGFRLNMLSLMALLGLSGVMINDAIIIVSTIKRYVKEGKELGEAVAHGARERLRPVILTTLTTIGGLTPLLFERSLQAQLVQPLAVTLIFGLLFSPLLVLFFVPALLGIGNKLRLWRSRRSTGNLTEATS